MRDQSPYELVPGVAAHSLQRLVSQHIGTPQTFMFEGRVLVWFSCGAASACAAKLAVEKHKDKTLEIIYCDTLKYEHPDNARFLKDVEQWIQWPVKILRSKKYVDIFDVFDKTGWLVGPKGARCTTELKKNVRKEYQWPEDLHIFGLTADEPARISELQEENHEIFLEWNLRDAGMKKRDCLKMVSSAGIKLPAMYRMGYKNNNCFSGRTKFLTKHGYKTLSSEVGNDADVLTGTGWSKAKIEHHGKQNIWEIDLVRNGQNITIESTESHEWNVPKYVSKSQGMRIVKTYQLTPGMVIPAGFIDANRSDLSPGIDGIRHGFVFGDGAKQSENYSKANFCGQKKEMVKYFDKSKYHEGASGVGMIHGLPIQYLELPALDSSEEYKLGFLCGLIASDGASVKGGINISNKSRETIERVCEIANSLGIFTNRIASKIRDTNYKKNAHLSTVLIPTICLRIDWILRSFHKQRFSAKTTKPKGFKVVSIRKTDRFEHVFCAFVPGEHEFTIEQGILTRNCIGCVKGGMGYWNKIRRDFPEAFARMAAQERKMGVTIHRQNDLPVYLDELNPKAGRFKEEPDIECGPQCRMPVPANS